MKIGDYVKIKDIDSDTRFLSHWEIDEEMESLTFKVIGISEPLWDWDSKDIQITPVIDLESHCPREFWISMDEAVPLKEKNFPTTCYFYIDGLSQSLHQDIFNAFVEMVEGMGGIVTGYMGAENEEVS